VRDVLDRYGPDGIRYFICAAGPESQDAAFTWRDFVQRNNSELVAGWGNLVSRTAAMVAKNFGEIPHPGAAGGPVDEEVRLTVVPGVRPPSAICWPGSASRPRIAEAMRAVGEVNAYVSRTEPFKLKGEDQRERLATILHTLIQMRERPQHDPRAVPAACREPGPPRPRRGGEFVPMPHVLEVSGLDPQDADRRYPVITGDYSAMPRWESRPVVVGTPVTKATPVFTKLDESIVDEELARVPGS
jgi:methionyl-tRNA synthetase